MLKFLLGLLLGMILTRQMQMSFIAVTSCVQRRPAPRSAHPQHLQHVESKSDASVVKTTERKLLLVGVMTADKYIATRARAVYETWGQNVPGKILFFTAEGGGPSETAKELPVVRLRGVDDSYPPQKKSFMMLKYMNDKYGHQFEFFMRADDDVFVKTDRLEHFLKNINSSKASFIGQAGKGIQVIHSHLYIKKYPISGH